MRTSASISELTIESHRVLSVLVPVFNEAPTIERAVRRVRDMGHETQIICVDDASTDGTAEILKRLAVTSASRHKSGTNQPPIRSTASPQGPNARHSFSRVILPMTPRRARVSARQASRSIGRGSRSSPGGSCRSNSVGPSVIVCPVHSAHNAYEHPTRPSPGRSPSFAAVAGRHR